jgi:antitoxin (DNA-binding transcriptional repressor) of toxin-antitoxin stability system
MISIDLDDLITDGADFFQHLPAGESCTVTDAGRTVTLVIGMGAPRAATPRPAGLYAGQILIAPDFNEPLADWDEALDRPVFSSARDGGRFLKLKWRDPEVEFLAATPPRLV